MNNKQLDCVEIPRDQSEHNFQKLGLLLDAIQRGNQGEIVAIARQMMNAPPKTQDATDDKWLTPAQAAKYAAVSSMTIWRWRHERGLRCTQVGGIVRIRLSDLKQFLDSHVTGKP